jgi:hypothetical protein
LSERTVLDVLHHNVQLLLIAGGAVIDVSYNVGVIQRLQQLDFHLQSFHHLLGDTVQVQLLHSHNGAQLSMYTPPHYTIRTFAKFLSQHLE